MLILSVLPLTNRLMALSVLVPMALAMWWKRRQNARDRKRLEAQTAKLILSGVGR